MLQSNPARLPEPVASGLLAKRPIAHLLVYALERALSGTFELEDDNGERMHIVVQCGRVLRVEASEPLVYLGHILFENAVIDGVQLSTTLAEVAATKRLHGQILLARGSINREQLADGLRHQRSRKLHHAFALSPRTTFAFFSGVDLVGGRPDDVEAMDPLPSVWRGIRAHPPWEHARTTVAAVAGRPLRLVGAVDSLGLEGPLRAAVERLRQSPATVAELVAFSKVDPRVADLFAYFLVITRLAEVIEPAGVRLQPTAPAAPASAPTLGAALASGEYVRKISFTMRAARPDANDLRIPSPMPGTLSAMSLRLATPSAARAVAAPLPPDSTPRADLEERREAEQLLAQAEMHMALGERENATALSRRALAASPGMPAALAFLAYLEAVALKEGHDAYLRDLVKMVDRALLEDDACRRGHFYRAELKRRLEDHEGAIRDLHAAVKNDPEDAGAVRELKAYERKVREGSIKLRSLSPLEGTPKPPRLVDPQRGKKGAE